MFTSRFSDSEVKAIDAAFSLLQELNSVTDVNGYGNDWAYQRDDNPYGMLRNTVEKMIRWHYGPETTSLIMEFWSDNMEGFRWNENLAVEKMMENVLDY